MFKRAPSGNALVFIKYTMSALNKWHLLEDFVYFNNTAFSSVSLCFTLGFRFKIS